MVLHFPTTSTSGLFQFILFHDIPYSGKILVSRKFGELPCKRHLAGTLAPRIHSRKCLGALHKAARDRFNLGAVPNTYTCAARL